MIIFPQPPSYNLFPRPKEITESVEVWGLRDPLSIKAGIGEEVLTTSTKGAEKGIEATKGRGETTSSSIAAEEGVGVTKGRGEIVKFLIFPPSNPSHKY